MHPTQALSVQRLQLPRYEDERGTLSVVEENNNVPFAIHRIFWISDVPSHMCRGGHAHWSCHEALFAISGHFEISIDEGDGFKDYHVASGGMGIVVPAGSWCVLRNFSSDAVCLVLASETYDTTGYCHDYDEWRSKFKETASI